MTPREGMEGVGVPLRADAGARDSAHELSHESVAPEGKAVAVEGKRGWMFYLHALAFVFGATLLVFVIQYVGVEPIFQALAQIGFGFFGLLALIGARHVLRALSLWVAVPPHERGFSLWKAFTTRIGGEAVTFLTFTGPVLGEATKAALLKERVPLASRVQALVVDNLLYNLSVALFISSGACVMLATYDVPDAVKYPLILIAGGMMLASVFIVAAVVSRHMPITAAVDLLIRLKLKRRWLSARRETIQDGEGNVYDFYKQRPRAF